MQNSKLFLKSPERISVIGFVLLIAVGTGLLMLPLSATGNRLEFIDALFTATSATCVTGLAVVDTGSTLSIFGQMVLLLLIQTGGLGIMTISTVVLLMTGRRPGMTERSAIKDTFTYSGIQSLSSILRNIFLFALVIEGAGMMLLFFCFIPEKGVGESLHLAFFHAVSAFCNAGFSTFSNNLEGYREDWLLNLTVCFLIICGGIGFLVISEIQSHFPFNPRRLTRLSLHTKLVLSFTGGLLMAGTVLILVMEWHNTLAPLSLPGRFMAAFFQAVTVRTAGFNTLPIGNMTNETLFLFILLMFIGASPGSCGGGIKTTTFATLSLLGISRLRGKERPHIFYRTIPKASVEKAISLTMVSSLIVVIGTFMILMSEAGGIPHSESSGKFMELFFEVISAFGTVGLSTGITPVLSFMGKLIITIVMFVGRLGPLVIAIAISRQKDSHYYYAEENIMIG